MACVPKQKRKGNLPFKGEKKGKNKVVALGGLVFFNIFFVRGK